MLDLAETIRLKFEQGSVDLDWLLLGDALGQALREKHMLIYLNDRQWAEFLLEQNWAGSLVSTQGDYLMVVDANVGFNKASAAVERSIRYQVSLAADGSTNSHLSLLYQHQAQKRAEECIINLNYDPTYEMNIQRCYWNYQQLIVPATAQLASGPKTIVDGRSLLDRQPTTGVLDVVAISSAKSSWGQLFVLAPQETIALDYVYALPAQTAYRVEEHWEYHLYLQKQPGTLNGTAQIEVSLPPGAQPLNSQPQPVEQREGVLAYQLDLSTDQEIQIWYSLSE
jgi:hypothetical protein